MKTQAISAIILAGIFASITLGNWADMDGNPVSNPNGTVLDVQAPIFTYNDIDGRIYVENSGANGAVDSSNTQTLVGDDIGLASWIITFPNDPGAGFPTSAGPIAGGFLDGVGWPAPRWFAGKLQQTSAEVTGSFLTISDEPIPVMQLPVGLSMDDFTGPNGTIEIEVGLNFNFEQSGATVFNLDAGNPDCGPGGVPAFSIVPEPAPIALMLPLFVGLAIAVRPKK